MVIRTGSYAVVCFLAINLIAACLATTVFALDRRVQFSIGVGFSNYRMDEINERYIEAFAEPAGLLDGEISPDEDIRATLEYRLSRRIVVLGGFEYLEATLSNSSRMTKTYPQGGDLGDFETESELAARGYLTGIGGRYVVIERPLEVRCGMDIAYLIGEIDFSLRYYGGIFLEEQSTTGAMFSPTLDIALSLHPNLGIQLSTGYRFQAAGSLKDSKGTVWSVESGGRLQEIGLDFEGVFITSSLVFGI